MKPLPPLMSRQIILTVGVLGLGAIARIPTPFSFVARASPSSLASFGVATGGQAEPTGIAPLTSSNKRNGGSVDVKERQGVCRHRIHNI